jgi:hypothetical protein
MKIGCEMSVIVSMRGEKISFDTFGEAAAMLRRRFRGLGFAEYVPSGDDGILLEIIDLSNRRVVARIRSAK